MTAAIVDSLLAAQAELEQRPVAEILSVIDRVCAGWLDRTDPLRTEAEDRLTGSTGLAPAMVSHGLDLMVSRVRGLRLLLDQDLGDHTALDRFVRTLRRPDARVPFQLSRAYGPRLLTCIFSGNVPGIPAFDMALALALKSACLARPAQAEPVFAELWARSIAEADPLLGRCLAVQRWEKDAVWPYERAGAVLAYGSDESLAAVRRLVPAHVPFLPHGHKVSFAVVARESADQETAARLACDVAMYDQQGCMSPHVAFVERGGAMAPQKFAAAVADALARLQGQMPRGRLTQAEAMALRAVRDEAEFTADACHLSPGDLAWAVIHHEQADFVPSPLNRLLRTYAVDTLNDVPLVAAKTAPYLQTVAVAAPPERLADVAAALGSLGATRICPVGRMQEPGPLLHHDGISAAGALVRWVDIEEES